jgi:hypothetical protein
VLVGLQALGHPLAIGDLEGGAQPVRRGLVGPEDPERLGVGLHDVAHPAAEDPHRLRRPRRRRGHVDGVLAEVGQLEVSQQGAAVRAAFAPIRRSPSGASAASSARSAPCSSKSSSGR